MMVVGKPSPSHPLFSCSGTQLLIHTMCVCAASLCLSLHHHIYSHIHTPFPPPLLLAEAAGLQAQLSAAEEKAAAAALEAERTAAELRATPGIRTSEVEEARTAAEGSATTAPEATVRLVYTSPNPRD